MLRDSSEVGHRLPFLAGLGDELGQQQGKGLSSARGQTGDREAAETPLGHTGARAPQGGDLGSWQQSKLQRRRVEVPTSTSRATCGAQGPAPGVTPGPLKCLLRVPGEFMMAGGPLVPPTSERLLRKRARTSPLCPLRRGLHPELAWPGWADQVQGVALPAPQSPGPHAGHSTCRPKGMRSLSSLWWPRWPGYVPGPLPAPQHPPSETPAFARGPAPAILTQLLPQDSSSLPPLAGVWLCFSLMLLWF